MDRLMTTNEYAARTGAPPSIPCPPLEVSYCGHKQQSCVHQGAVAVVREVVVDLASVTPAQSPSEEIGA